MSPITFSPSSSAKRRARTVAVVAAGAALLAACGSSSSAANKGVNSNSSGSTPGANTAAGFRPVTGKVVSVGGSGARVSTTSGKTNVAFASTTRFTSITTIGRSALKVGDCITATSTSSSGRSSSSIDASSITVASDAACSSTGNGLRSGGFGSSGSSSSGSTSSGSQYGGPGTGTGGTPPSGAPSGSEGYFGGTPPTGGEGFSGGTTGGNAQRFRGRFPATAGTVTAITNGTVEIKSLFSGIPQAASSATPKKVTVTTSASTTYQSRSTASASDVATGRCLTAIGQKASNGVVDAFMVTVSNPVNGACAASTVRFGGGFGGAQPGGTTNG